MFPDRHLRNCALLIRNAPCDCGHAETMHSDGLSDQTHRAPERANGAGQFRDRSVRADASREETMPDLL